MADVSVCTESSTPLVVCVTSESVPLASPTATPSMVAVPSSKPCAGCSKKSFTPAPSESANEIGLPKKLSDAKILYSCRTKASR